MATSLFSQSVRPALHPSDAIPVVCRTCQRNAATYRRTRKLLRVKVDPSFAPSKTEAQDHIIFNPPSSAPSPYDTPPKFLPKSDPRWAMYRAAASTPAASATTPASPAAPTSILASIAAKRLGTNGPPVQSLPPVRPRYEKKYHLTQEQIEEIRRLRKEDPRQWTRVRLAEKFECSQFFVSLCCSAPEIKDEQDEELARLKARWGRRKTEAREARQERKKLWGQDA